VAKPEVQAYVAELRQTLAPVTIALRLTPLRRLCAHLDPAGDWRWVDRPATRLRRGDHPRRRCVPEFETGQLLELGERLIALLALRPVRVSTLMSLELTRHLSIAPDGVTVTFPATEMKNRHPFAFDWPNQLRVPLARWCCRTLSPQRCGFRQLARHRRRTYFWCAGAG
jgi:hypothetical protein